MCVRSGLLGAARCWLGDTVTFAQAAWGRPLLRGLVSSWCWRLSRLVGLVG